MGQTSTDGITKLLQGWRGGDRAALDALVPVVYKELHRLAHCELRKERPDHTLQSTALVHEAYFRLVGQTLPQWESRTHFFAIAAQLMRQILVDYARRHRASKRGSGACMLTLDDAVVLPQRKDVDVVAIDDALNALAEVDPRQSRIQLIEGGPRVLPAYSESLSRKAEQQLQHLGVEVLTNHIVTRIEPGAVLAGDRKIPAQVVLWAAGVAASPLGKQLGVPVDRAGRVLVGPDLSIPGHAEVFVIGDLAALNDEEGKMLPGVAPVAIQQGEWVARTIARDLGDEPRGNFHYHDKGSLATIGRAAAVAQFGKFEISGFFAWLAWLLVHILFLIGFRNRLLVMIQWAWSYITYDRGARLITGRDDLPGWIEPEPGVEANFEANDAGAKTATSGNGTKGNT